MSTQSMVLDVPLALDQPLDQALDQRQAQRQQFSQSGTVSVFGASALLHAQILNISEGGTQIWLHQPLVYASLVRIEYDDNLILGEVVYCQRKDAGWLVGIRVEHSLLGLTALARAMGE
jgi:hypothetical protein